MSTRATVIFLAALILAPAMAPVLALDSTAYAQSQRRYTDPHRRTGSRSAPVLTNPRNAREAAQDCRTKYKGFRLCDWNRSRADGF